MTWWDVCAAPGCDVLATLTRHDIPFCPAHMPVTKPRRWERDPAIDPWLDYTKAIAADMRAAGVIDLTDAEIEKAYAELQNRAARE